MKHKPFSKIITFFIILLAYLFVIFACYEMRRLQDLSPIAYIGTGIVVLLATTIRAYMHRAVQQDLADIKVKETKELSQIKKEYGDSYVSSNSNDSTDDSYLEENL